MKRILLAVVALCFVALGVVAQPTISSLSPNSAPAGSSELTLIVTGTNLMTLGNVATPGVVLWNGTALQAAPSPAPTATQLTVIVPASLLANTGSASVTVQVGSLVSAPATFTVNSSLAIITTSLPNGTVGTAYSQTLTASGGVTPYAWGLASEVFVPGLSLSGDGAITGTPTTAGSFTFTIQVMDYMEDVASQPFTITIDAPPPVIATLTPNSAVAGSGTLELLVAGSNLATFGDVATAGVVLWNGTALQTAAYPVSSASQLVAVVPANLLANPGSASVTAQVGGVVSAPATFTVYPPLAILTTSLPNGTVGTAYSQTLTASGGVTPYAWSVASAAFVPGLSLSGAGAITGTPTTAGSFTFTIQVMDQVEGVASRPFTITIDPPPPVIATLTPNSAPAGSSELTLTVTGTNLVIGSNGTVIVGVVLWNGTALAAAPSPAPTPTQLTVIVPASLLANTGSASVTVQVGSVVTAPATFTITVPPLAIVPTSLPNGTVGTAYSQTLTASGGVTPYAWSVASGAFVPGLSLSGAGAITGTPTTAGSFTFTIQVLDKVQGVASRPFTITIDAPPPVIATLTPNSAVAGSGTLVLLVAGSNLMTSGDLPAAGVVLWNGTALHAAAPRASSASQLAAVVPANLLANPGSASVTVRVGNATSAPATFTITVPPLAVTTTSLPNGTVGAAYSQTLTASGGVTPYAWSVASAAFVPGLSLSGAGAITGTPTTAGSFTFTIQVLDEVQGVASRPFTVTIDALAPVIATLTPNSAVAGSGTLVLLVAGSNLMTSGNLPAAGVVLWNGTALQAAASPASSASQLAAVVPANLLANPGSASVTVRVGNATSAPATFTVYPPLAIVPTSLPNGTVGTAYSQTLTASGGVTPYAWSVASDAFVPGLSLSGAGAITGTPTTAGSFTFTIQVLDKVQGVASRPFTITIDAPPPVIATLTPNSAVAGSGTLVLLVAGSNLMTSGNLPAAGVVLWNGTALQVAASPASSASQLAAVVPANLLANPGSASVTVRVGNATSAPATFTITVPPLAVTTTSLPNGTVGAAYSQTLSATGGVAPYVWSTTTGVLPPGLALNATTGAIAGAPTALGSFSFTAQVTDKQNATASRQVSIAVGAPPAPSTAINGLGDTANGADQLAFSFGLSSGYPLPLAAHFTLTFSPDAVAPADDPAVQFAAGGRAIDVAIPAGTVQSPNVPFQTGTVAGTITVTLTGLTAADADITPSPALTRTVRINRAPPTLTPSSLRVTRRANGFDIQVSGFSTPREVTQALFHFGAVAGTNLNGADVTISLSSAFSAWYTSTASVQFGSAFLYTQPFAVQGDPAKINSVSLTLSNSQGGSQMLSANF